MKRHKNLLCLVLTLAMTLILMTGCAGDNPKETYTTFSFSDGIDENGFFEGVKALNYVKDLNYQNLPIPGDVHRISQESIQAEMDNILALYASDEQITNRAVADGDTVNIDYVGSVDGVEFDGGSTAGAGTDVTIGVTSYIDDFLEQLIGHTPGETINVEVTFPDDYHEANLQGKDALFVTEINYIVDSKQPELTDDFVKTNLLDLYGWETVAAMKEGVSGELQKTAVENYISEYLMNYVTTGKVPDKLINYQEKAMLKYYLNGAESYGVEFEEFLNTYIGVASIDELLADSRDDNLKNATYALVSQAVAESAKISVSEDDMIEYFEDYSEYVEEYGLPYLKQIVLFQNVIYYIADNSVLE